MFGWFLRKSFKYDDLDLKYSNGSILSNDPLMAYLVAKFSRDDFSFSIPCPNSLIALWRAFRI